jgi:tetratricopeptide (TPR) repeat protein
MARIKSIRKHRPPKKFRIPTQVVQWGIVVVVVIAVLFILARALSRSPGEPAPIPLLSSARTDLVSLTRMLGEVGLDSATRSLFPAELQPALGGVDTLVSQHKWYEAIGQLDRLLKKAKADEAPALRGYMGSCFYQAASLDRALQQFRKGLAKAESTGSPLVPWLAFCSAYLYQSRGYQDSAIAYHSLCIKALGSESGPLLISALNDMAAAREALSDTAGAGTAYREAAALVDSAADPKTAELVRENLRRIGRK